MASEPNHIRRLVSTREREGLISPPVEMMTDPRINAPVAVSYLPPDERIRVMVARDNARRQAFMDTYRNPQPSWLQRIKRRAGL